MDRCSAEFGVSKTSPRLLESCSCFLPLFLSAHFSNWAISDLLSLQVKFIAVLQFSFLASYLSALSTWHSSSFDVPQKFVKKSDFIILEHQKWFESGFSEFQASLLVLQNSAINFRALPLHSPFPFQRANYIPGDVNLLLTSECPRQDTMSEWLLFVRSRAA